MPFNGSGGFTQKYNWTTEAGSPPIEIAKLEDECQDMAAAFSNCMTRDGQGKPTAAIDFNGQNIINANNITASGALTSNGTVSMPNFVVDSFVNKTRNGTMQVAQRGASGAILSGVSAYCLDGWQVTPIGATVNWARLSLTTLSATRCPFALSLTGNTGMTQTNIFHAIESIIATQLGGQTVTISFDLYNNTGATITPQLLTFYPNATDIFSPNTADLLATNLQACPNLSWTRCSYTFNVNALASRGYAFQISLGTALNSAAKSVYITGVDARVTPSVTIGLTATPPSCAVVPFSIDLVQCQRYFQKSFAQNVAPANVNDQNGAFRVKFYQGVTGNFALLGTIFYKQTMRTFPTITFFNPINPVAVNPIRNFQQLTDLPASITSASESSFSVFVNNSTLVAGTDYELLVHYTLSAEL